MNTFEKAVPNLFGSNFEAKMKERAESVKILARSQSQKSSAHGSSQFFQGHHHSLAQRGGGLSNRRGRIHYPQGNFRNPFYQKIQRLQAAVAECTMQSHCLEKECFTPLEQGLVNLGIKDLDRRPHLPHFSHSLRELLRHGDWMTRA